MARKEKPTFITEQDPFPKRLKKLLTESNTTQAVLAKYVGCTRQAISLYATGQSIPDIGILQKIAEYFKVSSDYLLGMSDYKTSSTESIGNAIGLCEKAIVNIKKLQTLSGGELEAIYREFDIRHPDDRPEVKRRLNEFIHIEESAKKDALNSLLSDETFMMILSDIMNLITERKFTEISEHITNDMSKNNTNVLANRINDLTLYVGFKQNIERVRGNVNLFLNKMDYRPQEFVIERLEFIEGFAIKNELKSADEFLKLLEDLKIAKIGDVKEKKVTDHGKCDKKGE